jgi:hypothetical protein
MPGAMANFEQISEADAVIRTHRGSRRSAAFRLYPSLTILPASPNGFLTVALYKKRVASHVRHAFQLPSSAARSPASADDSHFLPTYRSPRRINPDARGVAVEQTQNKNTTP